MTYLQTGFEPVQLVTALMRELRMAEAPTPVQLQIIDFLTDPTDPWKIASGFRGVGKSTLAAMLAIGVLDACPEEKILLLSASGGRAEDMAAWIYKTVHDIPWLRHLAPSTENGGRYSRIKFDVGTCAAIEQSPSIRAAGIYGQITGSRASLIIGDDVETVQTALTQVQRAKLLQTVTSEMTSILKPLAPPAPQPRVWLLGTPHSQTDSIYFRLARHHGYNLRMWPARVPERIVVYGPWLAPVIKEAVPEHIGKPTDTRFTNEELVQREERMLPMNWRLQYMLDATLSDIEKYPLRCRDWMVMTLDQALPEIVRYDSLDTNRIKDLACPGMAHDSSWYSPAATEGGVDVAEVPCVMALDPAGGGADEFGWAIVRAWNGNYFLVESGGHRGGVSEALWSRLAGLAKQHGVKQILVETNFGGLEIYAQVLKPYLRKAGAECAVEAVRSNVQKELRILSTLAPLLQTHRMVVDRRVVEADLRVAAEAHTEAEVAYSLFFQMTRLSHEKACLLHDDRVDALAMACEWFQEQAALDQQQRAQERRDELINATIEDEMGYAVMSLDRQVLGMSLEQARRAHARSGLGFGESNWLTL